MWLFKNLKAKILKSIILWSTMGKQTAQAKEVYPALSQERELRDLDTPWKNIRGSCDVK